MTPAFYGEREPRGPIHQLDAGDYRAIVRDGVPMIEPDGTLGAVHTVAVPCSPEIVAELSADWSDPVQFKIQDGHLIIRQVEQAPA